MNGQGVRGFVGQSMSGARATTPVDTASYPPGSYVWTCPRSGRWRFVLWGNGGTGNSGGGVHGASGAYYEAQRDMVKGQAVSIFVGAPDAAGGSSATFPNGEGITAGGGNGTTPGSATANRPDDIVYNGSAPGSAGLGSGGGAASVSGAGAPGNAPYYGGAGGAPGRSPGGGGNAAAPNNGASGLALVVPVRV